MAAANRHGTAPVTVQPGRDAFDYVLRTCETAQQSGFDGIGIGQRYIGGERPEGVMDAAGRRTAWRSRAPRAAPA
jgi:hypothetical protein